jgi:hypothetical protein
LESRRGDDAAAEDLRYFGAADAAEQYAAAETEQRQCLVEPENWPAIEAFIAVQSQFRHAGFRYEGVKAGLEMAGIHPGRSIFAQLRLIEIGALKELSDQKP